MPLSRTQAIEELGINPYVRPTQNGWTAASITPPELPVPPGFLTPEQVVEQSKSYSPQVKSFSAADFLTQPAQLNDPKLASRAYTSVPNNGTPISAPLSVSAYQGVNMPSFLTNAVNQLNQGQSQQALMQSEYRQKLLNAVLSGNYLAAEALRASSVNPGTSVTFGSAVVPPQVGQAAVVNAQSNQKATDVAVAAAKQPIQQQQQLNTQLQQVQQQLSNVAPGFAAGPERARLTSQQFSIQQELDKLQAALPKTNVGLVGGSAYVR